VRAIIEVHSCVNRRTFGWGNMPYIVIKVAIGIWCGAVAE
jgi:hypothetical protein